MKQLILSIITFIFLTVSASAIPAVVSYYDCCNLRTASGQIFNKNGLTAASKTLPFGTKVRITYKGKSIVVVINDRGPFVKGRDLDLTISAARRIGCYGVCTVDMEIL